MAPVLSTLRPIAIASIAVTFLLSCAHLPEPVAWHEVTDGNLVVRSCDQEADTLELVADLREIRATLSEMIPSIPMDDKIPFRVRILCSDSDLDLMNPRPVQGNHFVQSVRGIRFDSIYESQWVGTITLAGGTEVLVRRRAVKSTSDLIRHHYAHHLIRAYSSVPVWIDEGLAAFVSTTKREKGQVLRGRMPFGIRSLGGADVGVPLGRILRAVDLLDWPADERFEFYQGSWTFIHFLRFARAAGDEPMGPRLLRFTQLREDGTGEESAAEQAFGEMPLRLRQDADRYVRIRAVSVDKGQLTPAIYSNAASGLEARSIRDDEVAADLGAVAVEWGRPSDGVVLLDRALRMDPENARLLARRARALALEGDWNAALASLARAEEREPESLDVLLDGARLYLEKTDSSKNFAEDLRQAKSRADRAVEVAPLSGQAHFLVGLTQMRLGEMASAVVSLEVALENSPGAFEVGAALAESYAAVGRVEDARVLAEQIAGWVLGERRGEQTRKLLDELGSAEPGEAHGG